MYNTLVVDDEVWMCEGLKKVIGKYSGDFMVNHTAMDGEQALSLLEKEPFDLVITDIHMPGMDGLDLLRTMREKNMRTPVIIFTGYDEFEYAKKAIHYDVAEYLLKPLDRDELRRALQKIKLSLSGTRQTADEAPVMTPPEPALRDGKEAVAWLKSKALADYREDGLSISTIADQAGFNVSYLSRMFKQETGESFGQFLCSVRMEEAKRLLTETTFNVADIAKGVGFWDKKHFSKSFKRIVGCTPADYRKRASAESKKYTPGCH